MANRKLGEICSFIFRFPFRTLDINEEGKGFPLIRIGVIDKNITEKFYDGKYDSKYEVEEGSFLIGLSGTNKVGKGQGKAASLNHC